MVKGGTIYRKSASKRFKKRKCPARNANVNMVVESENDGHSLMEIDEEVPGTSIENITVSESKVEQIVNSEENNKPTGYRFVDMDIMTNLFSVIACPKCYCSILTLIENKKQGLAFQLQLVCSKFDCNWSHEFWTSKKKSRKYDVNRRIFYSMQRIGNGYQGLKNFFNADKSP